jgi:hypothetical protein
MPEAPINEDREPLSWKGDVNSPPALSWDRVRNSISQASGEEQPTDGQFRRSIPPTEGAHPPR